MDTNYLKNWVLDLLFPAFCLKCRKEGALFCQPCKNSLNFTAPACFVCRRLVPARKKTPPGRTCKSCRKKTKIYAFLSPFFYQDGSIYPIRGSNGAKELIHALKYSRCLGAADILAELLGNYLARFSVKFPANTVLIPIPLHSRRKRARGFNQSELIAEGLARILQKETRSDLLKKVINTKPQTELAARERCANLNSSFKAENELLKGKNVLLLDDVKTTGATLEEAARTLKNAGAKKIWAITVAH